MQNKEVDEVYGKKVKFVLFTEDGSGEEDGQFTETSLSTESYYIFWHDSKMKNYELLIDYLTKKRLAQANL